MPAKDMIGGSVRPAVNAGPLTPAFTATGPASRPREAFGNAGSRVSADCLIFRMVGRSGSLNVSLWIESSPTAPGGRFIRRWAPRGPGESAGCLCRVRNTVTSESDARNSPTCSPICASRLGVLSRSLSWRVTLSQARTGAVASGPGRSTEMCAARPQRRGRRQSRSAAGFTPHEQVVPYSTLPRGGWPKVLLILRVFNQTGRLQWLT